jgi:hypothetical protein
MTPVSEKSRGDVAEEGLKLNQKRHTARIEEEKAR